MRNSRRRKYYHNRRLKLKVAFLRTLDYLDRNTTGEPTETDKYLKRRIKEIRSCRILPGRKHQYCRSICFCDTCIRQKTHDYIDQINKFRESINDQIYFFVRSEYFIDEGIDQEVIDQHIKYFEKQRIQINRSMLRGSAQLDGVIHRIEVLNGKKVVTTRLLSLFVSRQKEVESDSYFWKGSYDYNDHPNHHASKRRIGYIINTRRRISGRVNKIFSSKIMQYIHGSEKFIITVLLLMKKRQVWTSAGKIFKKNNCD